LKQNTSLKTLYLGENEFGIAGLTSVADALTENIGLTDLHLDNTRLTVKEHQSLRRHSSTMHH
jgi:hypothetical protein